MGFKIALHTMVHMIKINANAFAAGKFEGGNHVAVSGDDNYEVH